MVDGNSDPDLWNSIVAPKNGGEFGTEEINKGIASQISLKSVHEVDVRFPLDYEFVVDVPFSAAETIAAARIHYGPERA